MGKARDQAGNIWETDAQGKPVRLLQPAPAQPSPITNQKYPFEVQQAAGQAAAAPYAAPKAEAELVRTRQQIESQPLQNEQTRQQMQNQRFNQNQGLRQEYAKLPITTNYNTVVQKVGGALNAPDTAQGDLAVLYAFATAMDPNSVVRESEQEMAKSTASRFEQLKKQYNMGSEGARLPNGVRPGLLETMRRNVSVVNDFYGRNRDYYADLAKRNGFDPYEIVGPHMGETMRPIEEQYIREHGGTPKINGVPVGGAAPKQFGPSEKAQFFDILQSQGADAADAYLQQFGKSMKDKSQADRPYSKELLDTYSNSYLGQGISGANEGLASTLGAPADLVRAGINLIPQGINAIANTNIPTLPQPIGGGEWWKNRLTDIGSIQPPSPEPPKQFVRRVGQSVGASAVPALGAGGSMARIGAGLLSGLGGGVGAATAQQVAPGNPLAEFAGELAGGGATGYGLLKAGQRSAQRGLEAAIPTVDDLKAQAGQLYKRAEQRGITANPTQTQQLSQNMRQTLLDEGQLGPNGKITDADTKTSKAFNLIEQYSGREMKPKEMNTVRKVLGEGRQSPDESDQRLSHMLLGNFDDWANPMAPEFSQARSVSSRYLQAQDLERARELATANASQFTGSGLENALRTQYRGLDRGIINGNQFFSPDVTEAVQKVARGTPMSNFFRGVGRLAPTGPVSGMGSVVPALGVASMTNPVTGGMFGAGLAGAGVLGRTAATRMGIRAADEAELIARNGGALPQAQLITPELEQYIAMLAAGQMPKYLPQQ